MLTIPSNHLNVMARCVKTITKKKKLSEFAWILRYVQKLQSYHHRCIFANGVMEDTKRNTLPHCTRKCFSQLDWCRSSVRILIVESVSWSLFTFAFHQHVLRRTVTSRWDYARIAIQGKELVPKYYESSLDFQILNCRSFNATHKKPLSLLQRAILCFARTRY